METIAPATLKGGEFLIRPSDTIFTPEDFDEEQRMIYDMAHQFIEKEIWPLLDRIDQQEPGLMQSLLDKAGELGLLGAALPETYGGMGKDFITATLINEAVGAGHSFAVAMAAHTGIGTLPILYFGTPEQKQKYLPGLATGAIKGAYALTEPGAGSDALSGKTTARRSADGSQFILNGQKIWITNSGFADIFTVFAKVEGATDKHQGFSAFIVERNTPGLSFGEEEHKMGIKGSSTRQLFFQDCAIPADHLLGEIGKGHVIAFNILNIGRQKLCAAAVGAAKRAIELSVQYANNREQFRKPIASFGAIQYKLAEQAVRLFACESALYRTTQLIDALEKESLAQGTPHEKALLQAAEEYAVECAILKVCGSEMLDYVVDEALQIHGGNGFSEEYPVSRAYRDSRINRIFEGTNEINRLLILDMLIRRAMQGRLPLLQAAKAAQDELLASPATLTGTMSADNLNLQALHQQIAQWKKLALLIAGAAVQKFMQQLEDEQEILMALSDIIMDIYLAESSVLRAEKISQQRPDSLYPLLAQVFVADATYRIQQQANEALMAFAEGDELRILQSAIRRFCKVLPFNTKQARRRIAAALREANTYCF
ncbi:MAG: acyl-CoA dehydrogenase family protein [Thermoflavifilum aggregans]|nr:acyl-CoA dehydrogenase family protein [Thermoflavifilum aggregans]